MMENKTVLLQDNYSLLSYQKYIHREQNLMTLVLYSLLVGTHTLMSILYHQQKQK